MLSTSVKSALEQSIIDFNRWAMKCPDWAKYNYNDIRGILFNKMCANLKGCELFQTFGHWEWKNIFHVNLILVSIDKGLIQSLKFGVPNPNVLYSSNYVNPKTNLLLDELNKVLPEVDLLKLQETSKIASGLEVIDEAIKSINNFK